VVDVFLLSLQCATGSSHWHPRLHIMAKSIMENPSPCSPEPAGGPEHQGGDSDPQG